MLQSKKRDFKRNKCRRPKKQKSIKSSKRLFLLAIKLKKDVKETERAFFPKEIFLSFSFFFLYLESILTITFFSLKRFLN